MTNCIVFIQNLYTKDTEIRSYTSIEHARKYLSDQAYLAGVSYSNEKTLVVHPKKITICCISPESSTDKMYIDDSSSSDDDQDKSCLCC